MQPILMSLNEIPGVIGSMMFNAQDSYVAHLLPPRYQPYQMAQVLNELRSTAQMLSSWTSLDMLVVGYEDGSVILRRVDDMTILVLAAQNLNMMKLGIAFLSAATKLGTRQLERQHSSSPPAQPLAQPLAAPASVADNTNQPTGNVGAGGAVGTQIIEALQKAFAKHIGPFAKIVLNEELGKMGVGASTVARGQYDELIRALGNRLPDAMKRKDFLAEAAGLLRRCL
jgi:predicted regulator of Ras-like GTPase activity (Roadblock/LC7/MglB family)